MSKVMLIGNINLNSTHGGYGGDIFDARGISRCLNATVGGASQTYILIPNEYEYPPR